MKFLVDQDVYAATTALLRGNSHDVVTASECGLSRAADQTLLDFARVEQRVFVTRDRDFGGLVFVQGLGGGVIYLRIQPGTIAAVHRELLRALALYDEPQLLQAFLVVEPGRHRIRKVGGA